MNRPGRVREQSRAPAIRGIATVVACLTLTAGAPLAFRSAPEALLGPPGPIQVRASAESAEPVRTLPAAVVPTESLDSASRSGVVATPAARSIPDAAASPPPLAGPRHAAGSPSSVAGPRASASPPTRARLPVTTAAAPDSRGADASLDEILLNLRIGRVAGRTVTAWMDRESMLLPVAQLLEMGEVEFALTEGGLLHAVLYPGGRVVVFDPHTGRASRAGNEIDVAPGAYDVVDGRLFLTGGMIHDLFGITIHTDLSTLTSVVMDPWALPLGRRLEREQRWRHLELERAGAAGGATLDLDAGALGGAVLDWSVSSVLDDPTRSTSYAVGLGGRVLGGGLQVSARSLGAASTGEHVFDASYHKVWRDRPWLTQMRLGDGFSTGPRLRSVRGVSLTNAPFFRRSFFGTDSFAGRVGPGWDVELRQSGRTLDLARADEQGAFALDIPLQYGDNPIQVVAFGPHGEIVTTERVFLLGTDRLPSGSTEWGLSGGACRDERCALTGNFDLRHGITNRWTVRGGIEAFTRDGGDALVQPYLGVSGTTLPGLHLSAEALAQGSARIGSIYQPSPSVRVRGVHTWFSTGVEAPVLHDVRRRETLEGDIFLRPLGSSSRWFVQASVLRQELGTGTLSRWQGSTTIQFRQMGVELGLRRETHETGNGFVAAQDYPFMTATKHVGLWDGRGLWLRAEVEAAGMSDLNRVDGRAAYQVTPGTRVELGAGWRRGFGGNLSLSLSADLAPFRSITQVFAPEGERARVTQVTRGTVYWNEALADIGVRPRPGLERGGLAGYVFIDEDGDGVRDPGERGVPGVRLVVGGKVATTDEEGRHTVWDLVPHEPLSVWTDSASIPDPTLVPARSIARVSAPPSSYGRLDVALVYSREISGRVIGVALGRETGVAGLDLELIDVETEFVRPVRTFSDGSFYQSGVPPGRYELRVAPEALHGTEWTEAGEPLAIELPATGGAGPVGPFELRLVTGDRGSGGGER